MKAISDSASLIHLAKIGRIVMLKRIFDEILIPKKIYEEVIEKGKELEKSEIFEIQKLIDEKFIKIIEVSSNLEILSLDDGEKEAISLCKEIKIKTILIDEKEGFNFASMINLTPIRTTSLLLIFLDKKIINFNEYKESLRELSESGYFLDAITYERLLDAGKEIVKR